MLKRLITLSALGHVLQTQACCSRSPCGRSICHEVTGPAAVGARKGSSGNDRRDASRATGSAGSVSQGPLEGLQVCRLNSCCGPTSKIYEVFLTQATAYTRPAINSNPGRRPCLQRVINHNADLCADRAPMKAFQSRRPTGH